MTMTIDEHKAKFREILKMVEGVFMKDGEAHPVVFTVKDGNLGVYMIASMKDAKEKDALSEFMTKLVREGAEAIIFVSESWSLRSEDAKTYRNYPSIEANPNRIEIVSAIYSYQGNDMLASAEIDRSYDPWAESFDSSNNSPVLKPWIIIDSEDARTEGRFCRFWDKAITQEAVEWAES